MLRRTSCTSIDLEEYGGNKSAAAEALGVNNVTFGAGSQENVVLTPSFAELLIKPEEYFSFRAKNHALLLNLPSEQDMRALNQRIKELEKKVEELRTTRPNGKGTSNWCARKVGLATGTNRSPSSATSP